MNGTGDHLVKQNNPEPEKCCMFSLICRIKEGKIMKVEGRLIQKERQWGKQIRKEN
jgi:hypothetical protein